MTNMEITAKVEELKDLLYPDVAHERIDEVPLYIQQDYRGAACGGHTVSSHGCGITSLAMLSTYMADTILPPGMLAARYAGYGSNQGTDAGAFYYTPPEMGYYVNSHVYGWKQVEPAMQEGRKVFNLQHKGYFTRGGHYLVLSELTEDGNVMIRDSNIYNYTRFKEHSQDHFPPEKIQGASQGCRIKQGKTDPIRSLNTGNRMLDWENMGKSGNTGQHILDIDLILQRPYNKKDLKFKIYTLYN